jgi:hypothetical protein
VKLGQRLTILTEYVGSHDGFLKANKSDESLESFLSQSKGNKFRVTKCKLLMLWKIKITIQFQIYSTLLTTKLGEGNEHV